MLERALAAVLLSGRHINFHPDWVLYEDRLLNLEILRGMTRPQEWAVLGSSRLLGIQGKHFPRRTFFNHSLRRATLLDYVGLWQAQIDLRRTPQNLLIGIDGWFLDQNWWTSYSRVLQSEISRWAARTGTRLPNQFFRGWDRGCGELDSWGRGIKKALLTLLFFLGLRGKAVRVSGESSNGYLKRMDGSIRYHAAFRNQTASAVEKRILSSRSFPCHGVSPDMQSIFFRWLVDLRCAGTCPVLCFFPYHPALYHLSRFNDSAAIYVRNLAQLENWVRKIAKKMEVQTLGSFNPKSFPVNKKEMLDWMHSRPGVLSRLLSPLVAKSRKT